jgi:hypothetical protein
MSKLISVVIPCYNEAENIAALHDAVRAIFREQLSQNYSRRLPLDLLGVSVVGGAFACMGGAVVLARKLLFWNEVQSGAAPLLLMLLASLFLQNFLHAQAWVQSSRLDQHRNAQVRSSDPEAPSEAPRALRAAASLSAWLQRSSVYLPLVGYAGTVVTAVVAVVYFIHKMLHWNDFSNGIAPALLLVSLMVALQLSVGGVLVLNLQRSAWLIDMKDKPRVEVERRLNFEDARLVACASRAEAASGPAGARPGAAR